MPSLHAPASSPNVVQLGQAARSVKRTVVKKLTGGAMPSEVALVLEKAVVARHEALAAPKKVTGGVKGVEMKGAVTKAN